MRRKGVPGISGVVEGSKEKRCEEVPVNGDEAAWGMISRRKVCGQVMVTHRQDFISEA